MKVFAVHVRGGSKAKTSKKQNVQTSRTYTSKPKGVFQLLRESSRRLVSAAGNAIRRRVH